LLSKSTRNPSSPHCPQPQENYTPYTKGEKEKLPEGVSPNPRNHHLLSVGPFFPGVLFFFGKVSFSPWNVSCLIVEAEEE
jgi:hypothetical protein